MGRLAIEEVTPGQTAARPVVNANGMVLVQAGTELTASLITRLKGLGVATVVVAGADGLGPRKPVEQQVDEIERRFEGHNDDELMMAIKQMVIDQVMGGR